MDIIRNKISSLSWRKNDINDIFCEFCEYKNRMEQSQSDDKSYEDGDLYKQNITFGIENDMKLDFTGSRPTYITQLNLDSYVAPTARQIFLFTRNKQPEAFPYVFGLIEYVPSCNIFIGVHKDASLITILDNRQKLPIILKEFKIETLAVNQIIHSKETDTLVLIGYQILLFDFKVVRKRFLDNPEVHIVQKAKLPGTDTKPPHFRVYHDELRKRFIVPSKTGYTIYSFNGDVLETKNNLGGLCIECGTFLIGNKGDLKSSPTNISKPYKRYLTIDQRGRAMVFHNTGVLLSEYNTRSQNFIFCEFINSEFVILVSSDNKVILLDVKTGKSMLCKELQNPAKFMRLFVHENIPRLAILMENTFMIYEIKCPWICFKRLSSEPFIIRRVISSTKAARIAVLTQDSFLSFFSPTCSQFVGSTGSSIAAKIIDFIYDRGIVKYNNMTLETSQYGAERLFFLTEDKALLSFEPNDDYIHAFKYSMKLECNPKIVVVGYAYVPARLVFCCFLDKGDLLLYDYEDFTSLSRVTFAQRVPLFAHFHYGTGSLLIIYHKEIIRMSLTTFNIVFSMKIKRYPHFAAFEDDIAIFGYNDGTISINIIQEHSINEIIHFNCGCRPAFVGIQNHVFWVVTTLNEIMFGQNESNVTTIECPYPVKSVGILNNDVDLLIGLDKEIMVVRRKKVYPWINPIESCSCDLDDPDLESNLIRRRRRSSQLTSSKNNKSIQEEPFEDAEEHIIESDSDDEVELERPLIENSFEEKKVEKPEEDREALLREMLKLTNDAEFEHKSIIPKDTGLIQGNPRPIIRPRPPSAPKEESNSPDEMRHGNRTIRSRESKKDETNNISIPDEKSESKQRYPELIKQYNDNENISVDMNKEVPVLPDKEKLGESSKKSKTAKKSEKQKSTKKAKDAKKTDLPTPSDPKKNREIINEPTDPLENTSEEKIENVQVSPPKAEDDTNDTCNSNRREVPELATVDIEEPVRIEEVQYIEETEKMGENLKLSKKVSQVKFDTARLSEEFKQRNVSVEKPARPIISRSLNLKREVGLMAPHIQANDGKAETDTRELDYSRTMPMYKINNDDEDTKMFNSLGIVRRSTSSLIPGRVETAMDSSDDELLKDQYLPDGPAEAVDEHDNFSEHEMTGIHSKDLGENDINSDNTNPINDTTNDTCTECEKSTGTPERTSQPGMPSSEEENCINTGRVIEPPELEVSTEPQLYNSIYMENQNTIKTDHPGEDKGGNDPIKPNTGKSLNELAEEMQIAHERLPPPSPKTYKPEYENEGKTSSLSDGFVELIQTTTSYNQQYDRDDRIIDLNPNQTGDEFDELTRPIVDGTGTPKKIYKQIRQPHPDCVVSPKQSIPVENGQKRRSKSPGLTPLKVPLLMPRKENPLAKYANSPIQKILSSRAQILPRDQSGRIAEYQLPRGCRAHGTIIHGRAPFCAGIKPLGDVGMAIIVQPLPKKIQSARNNHKQRN